jgi:hypothetical protein
MNTTDLINILGTTILALVFLLLIETILLIRIFMQKWAEDTDEQLGKLLEEKTKVR